MAQTYFSGVKNKNLKRKNYMGQTAYTKEHSFGKIFKILPNKDM